MSVKQIIKKYGDKFFDCFNAAYSSLDMFIEIKDEAKKAVLNQFAIMINKDFLSLLVDENDDIVAFCVILPSFGWLVKKYDGKMTLPFIVKLFSYLKNPDALELTLMAVRPEYQKRGYNAGCFSRILKNVSDNGIQTIVSCPTLESNTAIRAQWDALEHEIIKRRQTYIKRI